MGGADHDPHARPGRHLGRGDLGGHAPAPPHRPGAAGPGLELAVDLDDLLDQRGRRVEARVGGEQPGGVGEQHQQVGVDQVGDQGGQPVVVAEADLVVGDGVVLVHDGQHAELEQPLQGRPGVQVLLADDEVERGEQHLAGDEAVLGQHPVVDPHQPALAHRRDRLEGDRVLRPAPGQIDRRQPGGDRARRDRHDAVALGPQLGHLGAELGDGRLVDRAVVVGDGRRADLGDDGARVTCDRLRRSAFGSLDRARSLRSAASSRGMGQAD